MVLSEGLPSPQLSWIAFGIHYHLSRWHSHDKRTAWRNRSGPACSCGISYVELIPASSAVLLGGDAIGSAINLVSEIRDSNTLTIGSEQTMYDGSSGFPTQSYYAKASLKPLPSLSIVAGGSLDQSTGAFPFYQDSASECATRK